MPIYFHDPASLLRFSDELDPARFANCPETEAKIRCVRSSASMMLGILYGVRIPVLSQNQVFDSRYLLDLAGNTGLKPRRVNERNGFLGLIRNSYIQMRIHPAGLVPLPNGADPFTLKNALASSLLEPRFTFSSWPTMAQEERVELARILRGESRAAYSAQLDPFVEAVTLMDEAFVASGASERAEEIEASLEAFVDAEISFRAGHGLGYLKQSVDALKALAERVSGAPGLLRLEDDSEVTAFDLNKRSEWRRLIATYLHVMGDRLNPDDGVLPAVSTVIDIAYNRKVGLSLGATYQRETVDQGGDPRMMLSDQNLMGAHAEVTGLVERTSLEWLGWDQVWQLIDSRTVPACPTSTSREQLLDWLLTQKVSVEVDAGRVMHFVRARLLPVLRVASSVAGASIGAVVAPADPVFGAALGAGLGAIPTEVVHLALEPDHVRKMLIERGIRNARASLSAELRTTYAPGA